MACGDSGIFFTATGAKKFDASGRRLGCKWRQGHLIVMGHVWLAGITQELLVQIRACVMTDTSWSDRGTEKGGFSKSGCRIQGNDLLRSGGCRSVDYRTNGKASSGKTRPASM